MKILLSALLFATFASFSCFAKQSVLTPENEEAAFSEIKRLLKEEKRMTANWIAGSYAKLAREGVKLKYASEWDAAKRALNPFRKYTIKKDQYFYESLAGAAEGVGDHKLAIKYYTKAVDLTIYKDQKADYAQAGAICAVKDGDYEQAIKLFDRCIKLGEPWAQEWSDIIKEYIKNQDKAEATVKFAEDFWIETFPGKYKYLRDATLTVQPLLSSPWKLDDKTYKKVIFLLDNWLRKSEAKKELRALQETVLSNPEINEEIKTDIMFNMAMDLHDEGKLEEALKLFQKIGEKGNARLWPEAVFNVGQIHMRKKRWKKAIGEFNRILKATVNNKTPGSNIMSTYKNYQHRACNCIASCYGAMLDFKNTLKYFKLSRTTYPFETWCGTCSDLNEKGKKEMMEIYSALAELSVNDYPGMANVAGRFMESGNPFAPRVLSNLGPIAVPVLIKASKSPKTYVRRRAVSTLEAIGPNSSEVLTRYVELLKDKDDQVACAAAKALGAMGPAAGPAVEALIDSIKSGREKVVDESKKAIEKIGVSPKHRESVRKALSTKSKISKKQLRKLLGDLGYLEADSVEPIIKMAMEDPDITHAKINRLHDILFKIGEPAVMPMAKALAKHEEIPPKDQNRWHTIFLSNGLCELAPHAADHTEEIVALMLSCNKKGQFLDGFKRCLAAIGEPAVTFLIRMLDSPDTDLREKAADTFAYMGPTGKRGVSKLIECARSTTNRYERRSIFWALDSIGSREEPVIKLFIEGLQDEDGVVAITSIWAIGNLGYNLEETKPALKKLTKHRYWTEAQMAAEQVLDRMESLSRIEKNTAKNTTENK